MRFSTSRIKAYASNKQSVPSANHHITLLLLYIIIIIKHKKYTYINILNENINYILPFINYFH